MSTTPYAKILVSIDGAASTSGGVTCAAEASIQVSYESTIGWPATPVPYLEIYGYPDGYDPGAGWTLESVAQPAAVGGSGDAWRYYGTTPPAAFDAPTAADWGKLGLMLVVGGGVKDGAVSADMTDTATVISVLGPNGEHDVMHREAKQFGGWKKWIAELQFTMHLWAGLIADAANPDAAYWLDTATADPLLPNAITTRALTATPEMVGTACTPLALRRVDEPATTTVDVLTLTSDSVAAGLAGGGAGVLIKAKGAAALQDAARVAVALTNIGAGTEASEVSISTRTGGAELLKSLWITPTGARTAYSGGLYGRNAADAADLPLVRLRASISGAVADCMVLGDNTVAGGAEYRVGASVEHKFYVNNNVILTISGSTITLNAPTVSANVITASALISTVDTVAEVAAAIAIDFSAGSRLELSAPLVADSTVTTLDSMVAGVTYRFTAQQHASAAKTITWPASVGFASGDDAMGSTLSAYTTWEFEVLSTAAIICTNRKANIVPGV